jgi:hypothetical protein
MGLIDKLRGKKKEPEINRPPRMTANTTRDDRGFGKEFKDTYITLLNDPDRDPAYATKLGNILLEWMEVTNLDDANCMLANIIFMNNLRGSSEYDKYYEAACNEMTPFDPSVYQWYKDQAASLMRAKDYLLNKVPNFTCDDLIREFKQAYDNYLDGDSTERAFVDSQMGVILKTWGEKCPNDSNLVLGHIIWDNLFGSSRSDSKFDYAVSELTPTNKEEFQWFKETAEGLMTLNKIRKG